MSPKALAVKAALASMKKKDKTISNPMEDAHENPAVEAQENTPGKKVALPLKSNKGNAKANSRIPAWVKPKGTVENPIASENPAQAVGRVVVKPKTFFQKAKTRKA